jgi:hypothetical protein
MKWLVLFIFSFLLGANAFALPLVNYETCIKFTKDFSNLTKGNEFLITEDTEGNQKGADINKLTGELFNKLLWSAIKMQQNLVIRKEEFHWPFVRMLAVDQQIP